MSKILRAKEPSFEFQAAFFNESLLRSKAYSLVPNDAQIKLDQNESPFDWPRDFKENVLSELSKELWNTYPQDYPDEVKRLLSNYIEVDPENIVLSPGSNYHITVLLNMFAAKKAGDIVITRPSFPLFEGHCVYQNIPYTIWNLDQSLGYNLDLLPPMEPGSCLFFASPNNPIGNVLPKESLAQLLRKYPDCYFVADEAYWEFTDQNYSHLLGDFSNLIIIRTFSKAWGSAGLRLSYVLSNKSFCEQLKKLTLPFLINKFTSVAAVCALKSGEFLSMVRSHINFMKQERQKIYKQLVGLDSDLYFKVINSEANFISLQCPSSSLSNEIELLFLEKGLVIRNVSSPGLLNCLRISMGKEEQNARVVSVIKDFLKLKS